MFQEHLFCYLFNSQWYFLNLKLCGLTLQKVYREDFEKDIKGRSSMDLDKTPEFLHVKYITNLLKEVWSYYLLCSSAEEI